MLKFQKEFGQGLVEYAVLILLIAVVVVLALGAIGVDLGNTFNDINNAFPKSYTNYSIFF